ncbi:UDP-N-acetylmuramate--L-alanine ligase [Ornithinimicrobium pekingense]|uniref:UDP-N-acetylmuramate--L-alanine ligase n=1 Tax=Ornithinimicrobium pekingense TaxID=384677 RepID=A0ABQ2F752_9MICO|nr:UDP-N-acetylmuramate--L-alanine ligase [Ornithinimicrobium pekingense]GGK68620.1 UDP-N-acetylmuramate--L-alanine ligase [Ornithinimicrobium pekingense]
MSSPRFDFTAAVPAADELGAVHFVAIGGSGMSGVARMYLARGIPVSGSDRADSATLRALEAEGARVFVGHDPAHLEGASTVVVSSAIPEDNPELAAARAAGLRVLHRSQGIAALLPGRDAVAVAGANGKTTTSAMTTVALQAAGADPAYVIGAPLAGSGTNAAPGGEGSPVVVEADESDGSFLVYRPRVAVVTNVQPDHLDFWGDEAGVERAYADFARTIAPGGLLVTNADDPGAARLAARARDEGTRVVTWGTGAGEAPDVLVRDARTEGMTSSATLVWSRTLGPVTEGTTAQLRLPVPGLHSLHNATAALLAATAGLGVPLEPVLAGLAAFPGAHRRFEHVGTAGGVEVVDDYAHNAPKVTAVVQAARSAAAGRRVVIAFQPHLFSRTRDFAEGFAAGLAAADVLLLLPVYGAREAQEQFPDVTSGLLADLVREAGTGTEVHLLDERGRAAEMLHTLVRPGDLVVTVGAGDITAVGPQLLELLGEEAS